MAAFIGRRLAWGCGRPRLISPGHTAACHYTDQIPAKATRSITSQTAKPAP